MRRIYKSMCAVALVCAGAMSLPLHAAALTQIPVGGGSLALTLTTTSTGLPPVGQTCITMNVSGTGAVAVVGADATSSYAGPVTVSGTTQTCGTALVETTTISVAITGNPLFGDFDCRTTAQVGAGVWFRVGAAVEAVIAVSCEVGGVLQGNTNFGYYAAATPTSVDASGAIDAYTTVGAMNFGA
jgi:hypothetical protein